MSKLRKYQIQSSSGIDYDSIFANPENLTPGQKKVFSEICIGFEDVVNNKLGRKAFIKLVTDQIYKIKPNTKK